MNLLFRFPISYRFALEGGFGSCRSFGVARVCAAMACAKSVGENPSTVAVRWVDMVRISIRSRVPSFVFFVFSPTLHKETFTCPRGKSLLEKCHSLIFSFLRKRVFVSLVVIVRGDGRALALTFVFAMWPASEAAHCPTKPNVVV